ncbi:hypothetical protein I2492_06675 [Budviciaceae bacterium CWB-B4]|uniref:Uncharacterized protein n=1 Tax=Limnobaculum xujianqingii TaxID=2738837 RepID=A0A9D7AH94_9GAMM|nr:hypothetical protein [Limnobaculum xujianqingii]MBK5072696.1 hypothetical protein [Limnobaculum xujianqingii]MBK5176005.1 hypothetical protein [Limnobaculum xujianqingii]
MSIFNKLKEHQKDSEEQAKIGFQSILQGKLSLAITFWLCWLTPTVIITVMAYFTESEGTLLRLDVATLIWSGLMFISIIRTSSSKFWKILSLVVVGADTLFSLLAVLIFFI